MHIRHIVVGVDGSENAQRGLRWALDLAETVGSEIVAVYALGLVAHLPSPAGPLVASEQHRDELRAIFENEWCAPLRASAITSHLECVEGNAVMAILDVADRYDAELIVVGSRGSGGFSTLHLGSTSHQIAQYATRPVVIVPPNPNMVRKAG